MKLVIVENNTDLLDQVITLANQNAKTLGFFPVGAFEQKAIQKKIIAAVNADGLYGYILFEYNKGCHLAYIVHLCVDNKYRQKGVSRKLLSELENTVKDKVGGIRVRCRIDYDANKIWQKLGFKKVNTVPGRSEKGSKLDVWRKNLPFLDLFQPMLDENKYLISACLDLNIFSSLIDLRKPSCSITTLINEDWLTEAVNFFISPELFIELSRDTNRERIRKIKDLASSNKEITSSQSEYRKIRNKIEHLFCQSPNDQSDLNHLAWCGAAKINYFVTADESLLKKGQSINDTIGVKIVRPSDLILHTDTLLRATEYQPQRLGESEVHIRRFTGEDLIKMQSSLGCEMHEGINNFKKKIRSYLAKPIVCETQIIAHNDIIVGMISLEKRSSQELIVHILRIKDDIHSFTFSLGILNWLIQKSLENQTHFLKISDKFVSSVVSKACLELGFSPYKTGFIRWTRRGVVNAEKLSKFVNGREMEKLFPSDYRLGIRNNIARAIGSKSSTLLLKAEKNLWPIKIPETNLTTYAVSVKPQYARHLFDSEISRGDLFASDFRLFFNIENSYYKSMSGPKINAPARILWYVSKGYGHFSNCQGIRAVSYLNEVHIDKPKELFRQFQHLGIFEWDDVFDIAKNNLNNKIMALVFSHTEIMNAPLSLDQLHQLWLAEKGKRFYIRAPIKITDRLFWKIYNLGMGISNERFE